MAILMSYKLNQYIKVFNKKNWHALETIIEDIKINSPEIIENPIIGDSRNEPVKLNVVRFIIRNNQNSIMVNEFYCSQILNIIEKTKLIAYITKYSGIDNLKILRLQLNLMEVGSFIGIHTDQESDSDYLVTVLLRTQSNYSNGELILYGVKKNIINQKPRTIFLMDSAIEHEVKPVTKGCRNTFVIVLGR